MFLNDTACNLASLNLMKFVKDDGEFDPDAYAYACRLTITAQEILVDNAGYPTPQIELNSHLFRPLGLGYANLGALLMSRGLAYDSDEGRATAATLTAIMTGEAYAQSARVARDHGGAFKEYDKNAQPFIRVIKKHRAAAYAIPEADAPRDLIDAARSSWDSALELGTQHGYRNSQVTVLAPTGTIAFMMDCDTTGVEPDIALIKYKKLVGEGFLKIVNKTVPSALQKLGYSPTRGGGDRQVHRRARDHRGRARAEAGAPVRLRLRLQAGQRRALHPLHGPRPNDGRDPALPQWRHLQDGQHAGGGHRGGDRPRLHGRLEAGPQGDRDLSRRVQALAATLDGQEEGQGRGRCRGCGTGRAAGEPKPYRRRLPDERRAITHKFQVSGHEGYITVGLYPDGQPGEIFLKMAKEGSTVSGLMDSLATMTSISLQYGVPLRDLVNKFSHMRFEPAGFTGNSEIPIAKSIVDYVFRWLGSRFLSKDERDALGIITRGDSDVAETLSEAAASEPARAVSQLLPLPYPQQSRVRRSRMAPSGRSVGPKRRLALRNLLLQKSAAPTSPSSPTDTRTAMPMATRTGTRRRCP